MRHYLVQGFFCLFTIYIDRTPIFCFPVFPSIAGGSYDKFTAGGRGIHFYIFHKDSIFNGSIVTEFVYIGA